MLCTSRPSMKCTYRGSACYAGLACYEVLACRLPGDMDMMITLHVWMYTVQCTVYTTVQYTLYSYGESIMFSISLSLYVHLPPVISSPPPFPSCFFPSSFPSSLLFKNRYMYSFILCCELFTVETLC